MRQLFPSEWGVPHPVGLAYDERRNHLYLVNQQIADDIAPINTTVVTITPYEDLIATTEIPFNLMGQDVGNVSDSQALNVTFDNRYERLLLLNPQPAALAMVPVDAAGVLDGTRLVTTELLQLGLQSAQGLASDATTGRLFILDSVAQQVVSFELGATLAISESTMMTTSLVSLGTTNLRGLAIHPTLHYLYIGDPVSGCLYVVTARGDLIATYELGDLEIVNQGGIVLAPSADLTDPAEDLELLLADSNLPAVSEPPPLDEVGAQDVTVGQNGAAYTQYLPAIRHRRDQLSAAHGASAAADIAVDGALPGRIFVLDLAPLPVPSGPTQQVVQQLSASEDDAEEFTLTGKVDLGSSDLELTVGGSGNRTVGIRFVDLAIPAGSTVLSATIEFTTDELNEEAADLTFAGEATAHAAPFVAAPFDLSLRPRTSATVTWAMVPPWRLIHETQRTPNLAAIVQELVARADWQSGNAVAFLIDGTGMRVAEAFDGNAAYAPRLIVDYVPMPTATPTLIPTRLDELPPTAIATATISSTPAPTSTPAP
ncbi:MAG: hypothetical protein R2932_57635 [Caldilineaceae bacterium]